jgi:hypothetical protein
MKAKMVSGIEKKCPSGALFSPMDEAEELFGIDHRQVSRWATRDPKDY